MTAPDTAGLPVVVPFASGAGALDRLLARVGEIDGVLVAALVETGTGLVLAAVPAAATPGSGLDPAALGAAAADLAGVLAELAAVTGLDDDLEDVVVTQTGHHHVLRVIRGLAAEPVALMVTLDRREANLALARWELREIGARVDA
jgi:hypothetical protein